MRKDIFVVGARILGMWLLISAVNPITYVVASLFIKNQTPIFIQVTTIVNGLVHLIAGYFLLFKTNGLFDYLDRYLTEEKAKKDNE